MKQVENIDAILGEYSQNNVSDAVAEKNNRQYVERRKNIPAGETAEETPDEIEEIDVDAVFPKNTPLPDMDISEPEVEISFPTASVSMAKIYESQDLFYEALDIYKELSERSGNREYGEKVNELFDKIFKFPAAEYASFTQTVLSDAERRKFLIMPTFQYNKMQEVLGKDDDSSYAGESVPIVAADSKSSARFVEGLFKTNARVGDFISALKDIVGEERHIGDIKLAELDEIIKKFSN